MPSDITVLENVSVLSLEYSVSLFVCSQADEQGELLKRGRGPTPQVRVHYTVGLRFLLCASWFVLDVTKHNRNLDPIVTAKCS